jgi:GMP synthase-like glutamine amidotransferase
MPRLLQIAHDHLSPAGAVADQFDRRGYDITELLVVPAERFDDPGVDFAFPDPADYDAVMLLGAPWSAYAADVASWVEPELELLRSADRADVPVLGICFGGQMLATAHGGGVQTSPAPEIGWHLVHGDDLGLDGAWFQWHYDRWVAPADAVEVARNAAASQAFVLRRNLAVQFHPEVDAAGLKGWLEHGGHRQAVAAGLDPAVILRQTVAMEADAAVRARRLVDMFLDRVAVAPRRELQS